MGETARQLLVHPHPSDPGGRGPVDSLDACVDRLGAALCILAGRNIPSIYRFDNQGALRLIVRTVSFSGIVDASFDQIRQYGRSCAAVTIRQLETIATIMANTNDESQYRPLLQQAAMIERGSRDGLPEEHDRKAAHERYMRIFDIIKDRFGLTADMR